MWKVKQSSEKGWKALTFLFYYFIFIVVLGIYSSASHMLCQHWDSFLAFTSHFFLFIFWLFGETQISHNSPAFFVNVPEVNG
jgi:hypothetical protein